MSKDFRSGVGPHTKIGCVNTNSQMKHGTRGVEGIGKNQYSYKLECQHCGLFYGVNGSDIFERKCPRCQGGAPGVPY